MEVTSSFFRFDGFCFFVVALSNSVSIVHKRDDAVVIYRVSTDVEERKKENERTYSKAMFYYDRYSFDVSGM